MSTQANAKFFKGPLDGQLRVVDIDQEKIVIARPKGSLWDSSKSPNDEIEIIYGVYQKSKLSNLPYYNFIGWFKEDPNA